MMILAFRRMREGHAVLLLHHPRAVRDGGRGRRPGRRHPHDRLPRRHHVRADGRGQVHRAVDGE